MDAKLPTIAVDAMGGDNAPDEIVAGTMLANADGLGQMILVGDREKIAPLLAGPGSDGIGIVHASGVVAMADDVCFLTLDEIRAGDFADVYLDAQHRVKRIVDAYGSRNGTVVAIAGGEFVMRDGHVITPARGTSVSLNGTAAQVSDLHVGDFVTVRYNVDSSEIRDITAVRPSSGTQTSAGSAAIAGMSFDGSAALRPGETFSVTLRGTPGGVASFDIGTYVLGVPLHEVQAGVYRGSYTVAPHLNIAEAPLFGHLDVHGMRAPQAQSERLVSIASEPPGFSGDFAPDAGATINNNRPSVYATFVATTVPVNPSSESIALNGHDVTSESTRTPRFIQYTAATPWPNGPVNVVVRVADAAGNVATKTWTFFIRARE